MEQTQIVEGKFKFFRVFLYCAISATCLFIFTVTFSWQGLLLCIFSYYLRMFGITAGFHRYFSHRAFKTGRIFQFVLAWIGSMAMQSGVLWWAAHHRDHHRYSDQDKDIHSPKHGFWHSHVLWFLKGDVDSYDMQKIKDFSKYPEIVWIDKYFWIPPLTYAIGLYLLGGWEWLVWGYGVSTFLLGHGTSFINSLCHVFGKQRFDSGDDSKNNLWLALLTMGEGWHNNHHYYQHSANMGFFWYEIDFSYYILKFLSFFGIVWDLRKPPKHVMDLAVENGSDYRKKLDLGKESYPKVKAA